MAVLLLVAVQVIVVSSLVLFVSVIVAVVFVVAGGPFWGCAGSGMVVGLNLIVAQWWGPSVLWRSAVVWVCSVSGLPVWV